MSSQNPQAVFLRDYQVPNFLIDTVYLHFDIHDDKTVVKAILKMQRHPEAVDQNAALVLVGEDLALESVALDGSLLSEHEYEVSSEHLTVPNVPDNFSLETCVTIYPQKNTQLMGLYQSRNNLCTQCESEGFRRITYFLDRPDVMARFTTTISADKNKFPYMLSNGNLVEEKMLDDQRRWVCWEDPSKKPCYLFALVAGDFDVIKESFKTISGRNVELVLYLEKGFIDQGDYAMRSLINAMRWDEARFGREYDLDCYMIVAVSDFNMGAMENKGLNIFNTKYILAKPETATDDDYIHIESVIGHEYFHNWTGNRITCRDWFQLTLKEGLTVFRDQLFTEDMTSPGVARIDVVNQLRNQQFPEDAGPLAHPIRPDSYMKIDNFYTMTVYYKGAEVIRMMQTMLTPEVFRQGMDHYFATYDGQAVTTEEFVSSMEAASGKDLSQFRRWYDQSGTPVLKLESEYDDDKKTYALTVKQRCPATPGQQEKKPFHMPLVVGLVGQACEDLELNISNSKVVGTSAILDITQPEETFVFEQVNEKPVPSLLRHFSAPVALKYAYTDEELALLFQCDSDYFARWEAGQRLALRVVESVAQDIIAGNKMPQAHPLFLASIKQLITDPMQDKYYLSRLLCLPSLKYLLSHLSHIDLGVLFAAKQFVERIIATELKSAWIALFEQLSAQFGSYKYDQESVGLRSLRNQCLYYLLLSAEMRENTYFDWALTQVRSADNMTDKLGALSALNGHPAPERQLALDCFYQDYKNEPLVVNKWLTLQASTFLSQALSDVQRLIHHPSFDINNPNNVYALLVAFGGNTYRFHEETGQGYRFIADQTLILDAKNPQVAARVVQPLTRWEQMDADRAAFMKAELSRIASHKNLSGNLYEIVTKSLGA